MLYPLKHRGRIDRTPPPPLPPSCIVGVAVGFKSPPRHEPFSPHESRLETRELGALATFEPLGSRKRASPCECNDLRLRSLRGDGVYSVLFLALALAFVGNRDFGRFWAEICLFSGLSLGKEDHQGMSTRSGDSATRWSRRGLN